MNQKLKFKTISGFKWTAISQVLNQLLVVGFNISMMHFLTPFDYGLFAVPVIIYALLRMVQDLGFTEAYIRENDEKLYPSFFWFVIFFGFVLSVIFYLSSPIVAIWTGNLVSGTISKWLSFALFFGCLFVPIDAKIRKQLDFKSAFFIEIGANLLSGCFGIWFVLLRYEWLSLPLKTLVYTFSLSFFSLLIKHNIPAFTFDFKALFKKFNFALPNISEQILNFLYKNVDTLIIGKYLGNVKLGLYDRAYKLLLMPIEQISFSFSKVMYPSFVNFQDDKEKIADSYIKVCGLISMVSFPMMLFIYCIADELVITLFGRQWSEMIPLLKVFSLAAGFQSISNLAPQIFYLTNKNWLLFRFSLISKILFILFLFIAVISYKNVYFVTIIVAATSILLTTIGWYLISKVLNIKWLRFYKAVIPQIIIALLMALILFFIKKSLINNFDGFSLLILLSLLSIIIVWTLLILTKNKSYMELRELMKSLI